MPVTVDKEKCTGCGLCVEVCSVEAISLSPQKEIKIEKERCLECGACEDECPNGAITVRFAHIAHTMADRLRLTVIQRSEAMLPTRDAIQITPSSTKELPAQFSPPKAVPSDESLTREIVPNTGILLNQTSPEGLERELPSLIREKVAALWGILGSVVRNALSPTSQSRNTQERIGNSTSRTRGHHHRHRGGR